MADTYGVLSAAGLQLGTSAANVAAPASAHSLIIKNITLTNQGANTETVVLYVNGTTGPAQWGPTFKLAPAGSDGCAVEWDGTLPLNGTAGDYLAGKATDATAVSMVISGDNVS